MTYGSKRLPGRADELLELPWPNAPSREIDVSPTGKATTSRIYIVVRHAASGTNVKSEKDGSNKVIRCVGGAGKHISEEKDVRSGRSFASLSLILCSPVSFYPKVQPTLDLPTSEALTTTLLVAFHNHEAS